eukprot:8298461-Pyramimonas_sp.AAC.2
MALGASNPPPMHAQASNPQLDPARCHLRPPEHNSIGERAVCYHWLAAAVDLRLAILVEHLQLGARTLPRQLSGKSREHSI